ncbi:MAG: hypothetical protein L0219_05965 [Phycisphaerales bacterium]|nr:hypothetical protein [Phycisphaerales bacterium]
MQFKTLLTTFVPLASSAVIIDAAQAAAVSWDGGGDGTNWSSANNWSGNVVPGQADRVTIGSAYTNVHLDTNATIGTIVVDGGLKIDANKTLTIDGQASVGSDGDNDIAGTIELEGSGSVLRFDDRDQTVSGGGRIIGKHQQSAIDIERTFKLTSRLTIEGMLTIQPYGPGAGTATFENRRASIVQEGVILANANGALIFHQDLILDDTMFIWFFGALIFRPQYVADGPASYLRNKLQFNRASDGSDPSHPQLVGQFLITDCGTLEVLANVETTGSLTLTSGRVMTDGPGSPCFTYGSTSICDSQSAGSCIW